MTMKLNELDTIELDGCETLDCVVVNDGTNAILCTKDGKVIGHQVEQTGFSYYEGDPPNRVQYLRATFRMTGMYK